MEYEIFVQSISSHYPQGHVLYRGDYKSVREHFDRLMANKLTTPFQKYEYVYDEKGEIEAFKMYGVGIYQTHYPSAIYTLRKCTD
jgi:hypothetical protein